MREVRGEYVRYSGQETCQLMEAINLWMRDKKEQRRRVRQQVYLRHYPRPVRFQLRRKHNPSNEDNERQDNSGCA